MHQIVLVISKIIIDILDFIGFKGHFIFRRRNLCGFLEQAYLLNISINLE